MDLASTDDGRQGVIASWLAEYAIAYSYFPLRFKVFFPLSIDQLWLRLNRENKTNWFFICPKWSTS